MGIRTVGSKNAIWNCPFFVSNANNNLCWVVAVCFQNYEYVEAFNASFFLLISLYLEKMLCCAKIWDVEEIGDSIVSSTYGNEVVGIPVKTIVVFSYDPFSSEDSSWIFIISTSLLVSVLVLVFGSFFHLLKTQKSTDWAFESVGDILSLGLLISLSFGIGVCRDDWLTIYSSTSCSVSFVHYSWLAYCSISILGVCAYGVVFCSTHSLEIIPNGS